MHCLVRTSVVSRFPTFKGFYVGLGPGVVPEIVLSRFITLCSFPFFVDLTWYEIVIGKTDFICLGVNKIIR